MSKKVLPIFPHNILESLCRAIGDIPQGISGAGVNRYLTPKKIRLF